MTRFGFGAQRMVLLGTSSSQDDKLLAGFEELAMPLFDSLYNFARWLVRDQSDAVLHLALAFISSAMIWLVWWLHVRARRRVEALSVYRLGIEIVGVCIIAFTGYMGGFLSGVNGAG
jgi:uncharacterized membrane protein